MSKNSLLRVGIYLVFFFSGCAGLIYQIVWTRMLLLTFGSTTHSVVAVLSAFMAGLALGSWSIGELKRKKISHLAFYAALELTIGIFGLASPFLFAVITHIYTNLFGFLPGALVLPIKFFLTFVVLLPPTTAMGATVPLVIEFCKDRYASLVGLETSRLYATNTLGATAGVLLTGFLLIELIGLQSSIITAATINIFLAVIVFSFSKTVQADKLNIQTNNHSIVDEKLLYSKNKINIALAVFALSGLLSMAYEIAWTRLLTPTTGTFIYAFSSILAVILFGIALGSLIYPLISRLRLSTLTLFGIIECLIGLGALGSLFATSHITNFSQNLTVILTILPASLGMGLTFPVVAGLAPLNKPVSKFIGHAYAYNTIGSMIGPIVGAFLLLPIFGTVRTILLLAFLSFLFALILLGLENEKKQYGIRGLGLAIGIIGILTALYLGSVRLDLVTERVKYILTAKFASGSYKWLNMEDETADVLGFNNGLGDYGLLVDGVGMSVLVDETKLMAHLPLLIHPDPQDTLVVAFGMGTTFRSALTYQGNVDAVELVPSVVKMYPLFFKDADEVLANPKGQIIINDGRNFVKLTKKRYDVITVDPPPPVNAAGTTVLYSKEFYEDAKKILKPGGLFTEWFFYGTRADDFQYLLRSFTDVFPYVAVFGSPRAIGIYLIGSETPITINQSLINEKFKNEKVKADLNEWGYWDAKNTPSLYIGDKSVLMPFIGDAPPVTDDRPRTEYFFLRHKKQGIGIARNEVLFPDRY